MQAGKLGYIKHICLLCNARKQDKTYEGLKRTNALQQKEVYTRKCMKCVKTTGEKNDRQGQVHYRGERGMTST
jgi:hypothetical protein